MPSLAASLAAAPIVLDGGLGTLLEAHGHDLTSDLWSARLLADSPGAVRAAHREFYEAGARVAISASYQVSYERLAAAGFDTSAVDALLARSVQVAREAREEAGLADPSTGVASDEEVGWVAASVGPYGAMLADGSEYTGDYGIGVAQLRAWHRPRLRALAESGADVLAVETLPSLAEVEAVVRELDGIGVPAWVSVTVAGGALRTGESLADAAAIASLAPEVIAFGVNCCDAGEVTGVLGEAALSALPGVAYPNSGEQWHAGGRTWSGDPVTVHDRVAEWVDAGARLVGGCCRVGPAEIGQIAAAMRRGGRERPSSAE
ncbi:homocysteine S-methyltransferase [Microbacterium sp. P02]|uniref:homocysteine S-methyltransferase n=1 Tax=Microbacterium sp. P02 TaxID=3366260 RepID=UPI00366F2B10